MEGLRRHRHRAVGATTPTTTTTTTPVVVVVACSLLLMLLDGVAAEAETVSGFVVSLADAATVFDSRDEISAITKQQLYEAAGDYPFNNPGYGLFTEDSNSQYSLSYVFDSDGCTSTVYMLERTHLVDSVEVCLQYMPFDLLPTDSPYNTLSSVYGVPMIQNPMLYDQLDCTFGQGPKSNDSVRASFTLLATIAALIALIVN